MNTNIQKIGFSPNQTKVYLALLSLGTATASEIAKKSNLARPSVYKTVDDLMKMGLVEEAEEKVKKFTALHPAHLVQFMEYKKTLAEQLLPQLMGIFVASKFKPKMHFYEGTAGVKKVFEDVLDLRNDTIYTFSSIRQMLGRFGSTYIRHHMEKRVAKNIRRLSLRSSDTRSEDKWDFYSSDQKLLREIKYLPKQIKADTLIQIYGDKVSVIASKKEDYAFIVESKELSALMKQIFIWLWHSMES